MELAEIGTKPAAKIAETLVLASSGAVFPDPVNERLLSLRFRLIIKLSLIGSLSIKRLSDSKNTERNSESLDVLMTILKSLSAPKLSSSIINLLEGS